MKLYRLKAIAKKEFLHLARDWRSLGMAIVIPMIMLLLFGYALTLDVDRVPLTVWDQDRTPQSREYLSGFMGSRYFTVTETLEGYDDIVRRIDTREALIGMVIPRGFSTDLAKRRNVGVQLIVDGSDSNTASLAIGYAEFITQGFSTEVTLEAIRKLTGVSASGSPVDFRPRVWFNEELKSRNFIVPGLIAVIMMVISALITALTIAREWETGTMEQLIATPVRGAELILGKLIPYFLVGMVDILLVFLVGKYLFEVPLRGSVPLLFLASAVFLVGALSMGMFASVITKSQLVASQMAMMMTFLPSFLLSGMVFAISNMPEVVQAVTYLVPARYFIVIMRGIYLKGIGLADFANEAIILVIFSTFMVGITIKKFRKKLD